MRRVCFLLQVKQGMTDAYKKAHEPVWDEMKSAIRASGISNFSLFLRDDGLLVGYFEAADPEESLRKLGETEVNARWQEYMSPYFEKGSGDLNKGQPQWIEHIFHLR